MMDKNKHFCGQFNKKSAQSYNFAPTSDGIVQPKEKVWSASGCLCVKIRMEVCARQFIYAVFLLWHLVVFDNWAILWAKCLGNLTCSLVDLKL
jgi:hypothetical protein